MAPDPLGSSIEPSIVTKLHDLAALLAKRNAIDAQIAALIGRPPVSGHLGEFVAEHVFHIKMERSGSAASFDGRFISGPLAGFTVNIKAYLKREAMLDMSGDDRLDFYLVLTGPVGPSGASRGTTRPWVIANVYLFDARVLAADLAARGRIVGTASSVRAHEWAAAEVFPRRHPKFPLTDQQRALLKRFGPPEGV